MGVLSAEAKDSPLCLQNILHHKDIDCGVSDKHYLTTPTPTPLLAPLLCPALCLPLPYSPTSCVL